MNGLETAEQFYETAGKKMIHEKFPEYESRIAAGLSGQGSDCAGFDDAVSKDHDAGTGFCLWITPEDEETIGFPLMRSYTKLAKEYNAPSFTRNPSYIAGKYGVMTAGDFFMHQIGRCTLPKTWREWFVIPEHALFTATSGKVFRDDLGVFSDFRDALKNNCPDDVRYKKIAAHLALAAQSGQYNYPRCLKHGETGASLLALSEFANHILYILFELNDRYTPFYKWRFRASRSLPQYSDVSGHLEKILTDFSASPSQKKAAIEMTAAEITRILNEKNLSSLPGEYYLEAQALQVMHKIRDPEISSLHLMESGE